jgi:uncharacterized protein YkwD
MPGLVPGIHVFGSIEYEKTWMAGHRRAEATPSFGRLCPAMTKTSLFCRPENSPRSPFSHGWYATTGVSLGDSMTRAIIAILGLLALAGCAGDKTSTELPAMYVDMAASGAHLDSQVAASMISQYRQNNGLGTVVLDPELTRLAESQSQAMAAKNKLDHDVRAPLPKRLAEAGYPATLAVENVSAGYHTLAEAFSGWRDSPPHRENMLKNGVTKMGIAASYAPNTKYKVFWTLILASSDPR